MVYCSQWLKYMMLLRKESSLTYGSESNQCLCVSMYPMQATHCCLTTPPQNFDLHCGDTDYRATQTRAVMGLLLLCIYSQICHIYARKGQTNYIHILTLKSMQFAGWEFTQQCSSHWLW